MSWNTLDPNHDLFVNLTKNPPLWWKNLLNDPQIYVDIRKDNSLNIYFMGASVMELCFKASTGARSITSMCRSNLANGIT